MGKFAHKPKKYASLPFKLRIISVQQDAPRIATATGWPVRKPRTPSRHVDRLGVNSCPEVSVAARCDAFRGS